METQWGPGYARVGDEAAVLPVGAKVPTTQSPTFAQPQSKLPMDGCMRGRTARASLKRLKILPATESPKLAFQHRSGNKEQAD